MTRARNTGDVGHIGGRKNLLINGNFDIWQRGTSGFGPNVFGSDRWRSTFGATNFTQRSTDTPPNEHSEYSCEFGNASVSFTSQIYKMESADARRLVGKNLSMSCWCKSVVGDSDITFETRSANAKNDFSSTSLVERHSFSSITIGDWNYYSFTFAPMPSAIINGLEVYVSRASGICTTRLSQVQLEAGPTATEFEYRPIGEELALCQRYYQKSYNQDVAPGTIGSSGQIAWTRGNSVAISQVIGSLRYPVQLRTDSPDVRVYSTNTGAIDTVYNATTSTNTTGTVLSAASNSSGFSTITGLTPTAATSDIFVFHYTADAEL